MEDDLYEAKEIIAERFNYPTEAAWEKLIAELISLSVNNKILIERRPSFTGRSPVILELTHTGGPGQIAFDGRSVLIERGKATLDVSDRLRFDVAGDRFTGTVEDPNIVPVPGQRRRMRSAVAVIIEAYFGLVK